MTAADLSAYNPASVTRMIFPCRHHFQAYNKHHYKNAIKLPDGRSGWIRFFAIYEVSGSVPR